MSKNNSLIYEVVLEHIKQELLDTILRPGDRLPTVAAMAKKLDVGQASVREAYRVLETLGILEVTQGRGTFVSSNLEALYIDGGLTAQLVFLERQSVYHLLEARKALEPEVAALAAERATPDEIDAIVTAAHEMEDLARQGLDFIDPDVRFHELIFYAAHNPVLSKILAALSHLFIDSRRLTVLIPGATEKAIHYHHLIASSIKEHNREGARALMYQHIVDVESSLRNANIKEE